MLEVKQCVTPSPEQWMLAVHGMRSAFKSWDKNDSFYCIKDKNSEEYNVSSLTSNDCNNCIIKDFECHHTDLGFVLGENDKRLLINLTKLGSSDRKVLRQLPIVMEITAPEFWFRQFDTYRQGVTENSSSQMHVLLKDKFTVDDFSMENLEKSIAGKLIIENAITTINDLREAYFHAEDEEEKKFIWRQILEIVPQSFNYTRTVSLNYEVALTLIHQRRSHKLTEWHTLIDYMLDNIPYLKELYEASCYQENTLKKLKAENKELRAELKELKGEDNE